LGGPTACDRAFIDAFIFAFFLFSHSLPQSLALILLHSLYLALVIVIVVRDKE
jgi:hypothetical protein